MLAIHIMPRVLAVLIVRHWEVYVYSIPRSLQINFTKLPQQWDLFGHYVFSGYSKTCQEAGTGRKCRQL